MMAFAPHARAFDRSDRRQDRRAVRRIDRRQDRRDFAPPPLAAFDVFGRMFLSGVNVRKGINGLGDAFIIDQAANRCDYGGMEIACNLIREFDDKDDANPNTLTEHFEYALPYASPNVNMWQVQGNGQLQWTNPTGNYAPTERPVLKYQETPTPYDNPVFYGAAPATTPTPQTPINYHPTSPTPPPPPRPVPVPLPPAPPIQPHAEVTPPPPREAAPPPGWWTYSGAQAANYINPLTGQRWPTRQQTQTPQYTVNTTTSGPIVTATGGQGSGSNATGSGGSLPAVDPAAPHVADAAGGAARPNLSPTGEPLPFIESVQDFAEEIPTWAWFAAAGAGALLLTAKR